MPKNSQPGLKGRLKTLFNPMLIAMLLGAATGLTGLRLPDFIRSAVTVTGDCMSPLAMILTGVTIAQLDLKKTFTDPKIYGVSLIRLLVFPGLFLLLSRILPMGKTAFVCTLASLAMPVGLNPIVIPSAYGLDSSAAAGAVLVSQLLCCLTIPLLFMFFVPA